MRFQVCKCPVRSLVFFKFCYLLLAFSCNKCRTHGTMLDGEFLQKKREHKNNAKINNQGKCQKKLKESYGKCIFVFVKINKLWHVHSGWHNFWKKLPVSGRKWGCGVFFVSCMTSPGIAELTFSFSLPNQMVS